MIQIILISYPRRWLCIHNVDILYYLLSASKHQELSCKVEIPRFEGNLLVSRTIEIMRYAVNIELQLLLRHDPSSVQILINLYHMPSIFYQLLSRHFLHVCPKILSRLVRLEIKLILCLLNILLKSMYKKKGHQLNDHLLQAQLYDDHHARNKL